nr:unnamed protein product [Callosobruchus analis]
MTDEANIRPKVLKAIHDRIMDFLRRNTNYSGKDIEHLDARLNVKIMDDLFTRKYPDLKVLYGFYANYFKSTIRLREPKVDTWVTRRTTDQSQESPTLGHGAKMTAEAELHVYKDERKHFMTKSQLANEIWSMILHNLDNFLDRSIQELHLSSDQYRNHTMIRFLLSLTDAKRFLKITHYFPIRDYLFLPNVQNS